MLFTGDYRFDQTPVHGGPADMHRLARFGDEGLLLLCADSTNADRDGFAASESAIGPALTDVFSRCSGRIVVTSFASNIHRVQQVVDASRSLQCRVLLLGRSMVKNMKIARRLGHVTVGDEDLIKPNQLRNLADDEVVVMCTGSQGEPLSALRRMAYAEHREIRLKRGDTVVFSATSIPGNERAVNETIDHLAHIGCDVVTAKDAPIHTSGHGHREEMKLMLNLTRPRYVMPVHGDHRRIQQHRDLAVAVRIPPEHVFCGENGLPLELDTKGARFGKLEHAA